MAVSNRERVQRASDVVVRNLAAFVEREARKHAGGEWLASLQARGLVNLDEAGEPAWSLDALLGSMLELWAAVFAKTLGDSERRILKELADGREHRVTERPVSSDDAHRSLDSMERLLRAIGAAAGADEIQRQRIDLQRQLFAEQARNEARRPVHVEGSPKRA